MVELALVSYGSQLNRDEQLDNAKRLAQIASKMNLDIDSRRLFVKACSAILQLQISTGAKTFPDKELAERYRGEFDGMRIIEKQEFEG